jgi:O-antigen/teichoic acid export membrane protein
MFNIDNIISKYSKKFGLNLGYFLKNGFWTFFSLIITIFFNLILSYLITSNFSKESTGIWFFIISVSSIVLLFTFQGIDIVCLNDFLKNKNKYQSILKVKLFSSIIGITVLLITSIIYLFIKTSNPFNYVILLIIFLLISNFSIYLKYLYSKNKFKKLNMLIILRSSLVFIITSILIINKFQILVILYAFLLTQALFDLVLYFLIKKDIKTKSEKITKKDIITGFKFSLVDVFKQGSAQIDKIIIPFFLSLELLAIYSIAYIIPKTILSISNKFVFHIMYKKIKKYEIDFKLLNKLILLITIGLFILIPIINKIMELLYPLYLESIFYTNIIIMFIPITILTQILTKYFETKNNADTILKLNIISNSISVVLYFILLPIFGILGLIISKIIKDIINTSYLYLKIKN